MLELGLKLTIAYLMGSVLGGLLVGFLWGGVDIRKAGSGNPGGTNALRTQGKWFALCVMIVDVGKGVLAITLVPLLVLPGVGIDAAVPRDLVVYSVAFAAILGHVFPLWFDFKGGKGGATAAGLLVVLAPKVAPFILGTWLAIALLTGYVGLATMSAAVVAAIVFGIGRGPDEHGLVVFGALVAVLILYTHRGNIRRMLNGTESRFRHKQSVERDT
jgi:glycerol-3-phosphate acyltransferase PlsY